VGNFADFEASAAESAVFHQSPFIQAGSL